MAVFNVSVTTVMLVEADSEDGARLGAEKYLRQLGVEVMDDMTDAFESEPLDHGPEFTVPASGKAAMPVGEK